MVDTKYGFGTVLDLPYEEAIARVTAALKDQGFGVLTEIDVKATLKQKLDVDHRRYVILGACNPPLAHRALQAEPDIGLLLPCNVIVYEGDQAGQSVVSIVDPMVMVQMSDNTTLADVAAEAQQRLKNVIDALSLP
jgi:uncharacterized protein (DUF302 family)